MGQYLDSYMDCVIFSVLFLSWKMRTHQKHPVHVNFQRGPRATGNPPTWTPPSEKLLWLHLRQMCVYIYICILHFIFAYTAIAHVVRKYICCTNNSIFAGLKPCGYEIYGTSWNGFGLLQHHELCIVWLFVQCVLRVFQSYKTPLDITIEVRKPGQGMSRLVGLESPVRAFCYGRFMVNIHCCFCLKWGLPPITKLPSKI